MFYKMRVLENFGKFTGKLLSSLYLVKLQASSLQLYQKKRIQHRCLPLNFAKFLSIPILSSLWLLLRTEICFIEFYHQWYSFCNSATANTFTRPSFIGSWVLQNFKHFLRQISKMYLLKYKQMLFGALSLKSVKNVLDDSQIKHTFELHLKPYWIKL